MSHLAAQQCLRHNTVLQVNSLQLLLAYDTVPQFHGLLCCCASSALPSHFC
jgi:hypothetical protein